MVRARSTIVAQRSASSGASPGGGLLRETPCPAGTATGRGRARRRRHGRAREGARRGGRSGRPRRRRARSHRGHGGAAARDARGARAAPMERDCRGSGGDDVDLLGDEQEVHEEPRFVLRQAARPVRSRRPAGAAARSRSIAARSLGCRGRAGRGSPSSRCEATSRPHAGQSGIDVRARGALAEERSRAWAAGRRRATPRRPNPWRASKPS